MWQRKNNRSKTLNTPVDVELLKSKASAYCALSEHCLSEVGDKLISWGASAEQKELVLDWLQDENYISEERYCRAFVADKIRFQGWGKQKISLALAQKRLPKSLVREALDAFPEEEYLAKLADLAEKKSRQLAAEEPRQAQNKLLRFLASRGFSFSDISRVLSDLPAPDDSF